MRDLATFLREQRNAIIAVWEKDARELPSAKRLRREELIDFIPGLLDRIASHLEQLAAGQEHRPDQSAAWKHARDRLGTQYSLEDMVEELAILRGAIIRLWHGADERAVLNRALDRSIMAAVTEFIRLRDREREAARLALEQSQARLRALATAGSMLSSSLDLEKTLDHVAQMVVPEFADWCAVDLVQPDGTLGEFVAVAHADPEKVDMVRDLRRRFPPRMNQTTGVPLVISTGKVNLVEQVDRRWLDENLIFEEQRVLTERLEVRSVVTAPLKAREIAFGALILAQAESGRRFTEDDLPFVEELARRASAAIDNARLFQEQRRAVELRDRILAVVSHDLRNPLAAIDLGAALLLKSSAVRSDPNSRKQAETIQRSAARMDRLITDLLDMSSIQAGRLSLQRLPCPLKPILCEVTDAHEPNAIEKGISMERSFDALDPIVLCDHDRIVQALSNLVGNAVKFCNSGDVITVSSRVEGDEALVTVRDTGPGIGPEDLSLVFELYWHGKARAHRSTGLGLFIARGIVEAHGGRLWVESTLGRGTTFFLTLPLARE